MTLQSRRSWVRILWRLAVLCGLFVAAATAGSVSFFEFGTKQNPTQQVPQAASPTRAPPATQQERPGR